MSKNDIKNVVVQLLINSYGISKDDLNNNNSFQQLDIDSIVIMDIQVDLERELKIDIPDGNILSQFTLDDVVEYIVKLKNQDEN